MRLPSCTRLFCRLFCLLNLPYLPQRVASENGKIGQYGFLNAVLPKVLQCTHSKRPTKETTIKKEPCCGGINKEGSGNSSLRFQSTSLRCPCRHWCMTTEKIADHRPAFWLLSYACSGLCFNPCLCRTEKGNDFLEEGGYKKEAMTEFFSGNYQFSVYIASLS